MYWYEREGKAFSPVISTRVRFARNLDEVPFPHLLDETGKRDLNGIGVDAQHNGQLAEGGQNTPLGVDPHEDVLLHPFDDLLIDGLTR